MGTAEPIVEFVLNGEPVRVPLPSPQTTLLDALRAAAVDGARVAYAADPSLATLQVLARSQV